MQEIEPVNSNPGEQMQGDRLLYAIARGVLYERNRAIIDRIDSISDPQERLVQIRQEQWLRREELGATFDTSSNYRGIIQVLGLLEEREGIITGRTNDAWFVWPTVKRVELEINSNK